MEFKMLFLIVGTIVCMVQHVTASSEALLECGRVHEIDNIANLSTATASYSNSQCMLVCVVGSAILPVESIHEGHNCPEDTNGICRAGQCIGGQEDALRECGLKHHLDFHKVDNHQGTAFTNDQCTLECVLGGVELLVNHLHEGLPCPANPNGVCRSGTCVTQSTTNPGSTITPKPTTVTHPSIDSFSPSKMKFLNFSLDYTVPLLKPHEQIQLYFYETMTSDRTTIGYFHLNSSQPNYYVPRTISDIPRSLNKASQMSIDFLDSNLYRLTEQHVDLYTLFATFYQNHIVDFGGQENFAKNFPIHRKTSPHEKLMDVMLHFKIVFSDH